MQKFVTIYSKNRTTHKYGNILQMKIEKYNYCMPIYVKIYPQLEKQASYFSKTLLNNLFNSKHVHMYHSDTVHRHTQ
jgi:hypothetical protein